MKIIGIIPARYASSRFPGKPLAMINGKTMIQRVYEQTLKCKQLSEVVVATEDQRIAAAVKKFNGNVVMTSSKHLTGTDRCHEALKKTKIKYDAVINIQGDEPFIHPDQISLVAKLFTAAPRDRKTATTTQIATLVMKISRPEELTSHHAVKVVLNKNKEALYFSRAAVPHYRNSNVSEWMNLHTYFKHIGIYGYTTSVLAEITKLKPSSLEKAESLEQLRWLENGYKIKVAITNKESVAIDTPEDLENALKVHPWH